MVKPCDTSFQDRAFSMASRILWCSWKCGESFCRLQSREGRFYDGTKHSVLIRSFWRMLTVEKGLEQLLGSVTVSARSGT
jgi:hypothetical protein